MASKVSGLLQLEKLDHKEPLSLRRFIHNASGDQVRAPFLFITSNQAVHDSMKPLISLWCDILIGETLSLPPCHKRRLWFVLDELPSLEKLPSLPALLERGRKHGACGVLGVQSMPQLRAIYGRDGAAALCSQPQIWTVLRSVEPETAAFLEKALGSVEIEESKESVSMGVNSERDGISLARHTAQKALVMASEIQTLPDL